MAKGGVGAATGAAVVSVTASATGSGLGLSTTGAASGSFSGGGVGSEGSGETFGSSKDPGGAARRLLKDWATEKAGLAVGSGGLNKLPDAAPLDKSAPVDSSTDFWRPAPKLNCAAAALPSPVSPKVNEPAAGLVEESLASSPWPTRSPEKLPSVSPPIGLRGCGSILRGVEAGLSPDMF